jgi:hypothetical protein
VTLCFSLVCLLIFVWFGVTVDLGERTLFGHLRAIGSSREAKDLWDGTKSKVNDFIGIEAAKRAAAAKAREAAGRLGPPQENLSPRDQRQMQELTGGAKRTVQGRTAPRPPEKPAAPLRPQVTSKPPANKPGPPASVQKLQ